MTETVTPLPTVNLLRLAGWAGLLSSALLLVATGRRAGFVPDITLTHVIAPPASALALLTLSGLYAYQRTRFGSLGLIGFALNLLGLAGLFAVEFTTQLVFPYLSKSTQDELLAGPPRTAFLVVAVVFLLGVVLFSIASFRARVLPVPPVVLYLAGLGTAALRGTVPEIVYQVALTVGAVGVAWLSVLLLRYGAPAGAPRVPATVR